MSIPASGKRGNRIGSEADVDKIVPTVILKFKKPQLYSYYSQCLQQTLHPSTREQNAWPRNRLPFSQGAEFSNPEVSHPPTREQNAQPRSKPSSNQGAECSTRRKPSSNQGAECSTQKQAIVQPGSRMLNPEASHCPTRKQNAQPRSKPSSNQGAKFSTQKQIE